MHTPTRAHTHTHTHTHKRYIQKRTMRCPGFHLFLLTPAISGLHDLHFFTHLPAKTPPNKKKQAYVYTHTHKKHTYLHTSIMLESSSIWLLKVIDYLCFFQNMFTSRTPCGLNGSFSKFQVWFPLKFFLWFLTNYCSDSAVFIWENAVVLLWQLGSVWILDNTPNHHLYLLIKLLNVYFLSLLASHLLFKNTILNESTTMFNTMEHNRGTHWIGKQKRS